MTCEQGPRGPQGAGCSLPCGPTTPDNASAKLPLLPWWFDLPLRVVRPTTRRDDLLHTSPKGVAEAEGTRGTVRVYLVPRAHAFTSNVRALPRCNGLLIPIEATGVTRGIARIYLCPRARVRF